MSLGEVSAAVLSAPGRIEFQTFATPSTQSDDGLLEVEATGICGSDRIPYAGLRGPQVPHILGHEVVGRIGAIGAIAAKRWGVGEGDRVVVEEAIPCQSCGLCRSGRAYLCDPLHGTAGLRYGSTPVAQAPSLWGGLSEVMYLHPNAVVHRIADSVPVEIAPLFIPLANGIRWVQGDGGCRIGDTVIIQGPGQHGLGCVAAAKLAGAGCVIVMGTAHDARRLEVATLLGADHVLVSGPDGGRSAVLEITGGSLADLVVDVTASAPEALSDAIGLVKVGGTVIAAGGKHGRSVSEFPSDDLLIKEVTIKGVYGRDSRSVATAITIIESGVLPLAAMCTHSYDLADADAALRALGGQAVVDPIHITVVARHSTPTNPVTRSPQLEVSG
ncbi:MAG: hypothetical protein JWQ20_4600 [Conexibacter sp.]|nr:hypothetical protein [Conexibacter sp.]